MFGYVKPVSTELLVKEDAFYRALYCGICRQMKAYTGSLSRVCLTYDSVFLALVRMVYLPDGDFGVEKHRCPMHPLKPRPMLKPNPATEYTARVFALLSYYKLQDDLSDEGLLARVGKAFLRPICAGAKRRAEAEALSSHMASKLSEISRLEKEGCESVDTLARPFGALLGEVFANGYEGNDRLVLYTLGDHLGRFIYVADAAEDYEQDRKRARFNPFVLHYGAQGLSEESKQAIHTGLLLTCRGIEGAVNLLPFGHRATLENLIRNIIYLGLPERIRFLCPKQDDPVKHENNKA